MKPPLIILVTPHASAIRQGIGKKAEPIPFLWGAELVGTGIQVRGYDCAHQAVGALVREAVQTFEEPDHVFEFIAGLFGDPTVRDHDSILGRAVHYANKNKGRVNPGVTVRIQQPPAMKGERSQAVKGGAA